MHSNQQRNQQPTNHLQLQRDSFIAMASSTIDSIPIGAHCPLVVSVEGNIGSGKSTFLQYCVQQPFIEVAYEPVDTWTNYGGTNLLVSQTPFQYVHTSFTTTTAPFSISRANSTQIPVNGPCLSSRS